MFVGYREDSRGSAGPEIKVCSTKNDNKIIGPIVFRVTGTVSSAQIRKI